MITTVPTTRVRPITCADSSSGNRRSESRMWIASVVFWSQSSAVSISFYAGRPESPWRPTRKSAVPVHRLLIDRRRQPAPHVVVRDQAAEDDDRHPDQESANGQSLDRGAVHEGVFPVPFVAAQGALKRDGHDGANRHQRHLEPERERDQLADRFTD